MTRSTILTLLTVSPIDSLPRVHYRMPRRLQCERLVQNFDRALRCGRRWVVFDVKRRESYPPRSLGQQDAVAEKDKARGPPLLGVPMREQGKKLRSDARRFTACDGNGRHVGAHCSAFTCARP